MPSATHDSKEKEQSVPVSELDRLAGGLDRTPAFLSVDGLHAGYGRMQVVHDLSLRASFPAACGLAASTSPQSRRTRS
jgi:hypothetical protein